MAHSIQRKTLKNMTEITILIFIAEVQAAVQLRMTNAAGMKTKWARAVANYFQWKVAKVCSKSR